MRTASKSYRRGGEPLDPGAHAVKRLGYTRKNKTFHATERDENEEVHQRTAARIEKGNLPWMPAS